MAFTPGISWMITKIEGRESIVVVATKVRTIASSNPRFADVKRYLEEREQANEPVDGDYVLGLIDSGPNAVRELMLLSERVTYRNGKIYFDGDEVESALTSHLVRMVQNDDDNIEGYALFLENLASNPRRSSRNALFEWIADRNLTITPAGEFIAYKGVNSDRTSWHAGRAMVDGVEHNGHIPNEPGTVISMPRSAVDPERDSACSTGLHVGTRSYASGYGTRMIIVAVNPRDVVMVPRHGDGQKMRVCRYTVLEDNDAELSETTYVGKRRYTEEPEESVTAPCEECDEELREDGLCNTCDEEAIFDQEPETEEEEALAEVGQESTDDLCWCGSRCVNGRCPNE